MTIQLAPPAPITPRPPSVSTAADEGVLKLEDEAAAVLATASPTGRESILGPVPQPIAVLQAVVPQETFVPPLNEILDLLRAQQSQITSTQTAEQERQRQQADADVERNRVIQEQEDRIQVLEAGLARMREEPEQERGTRRVETLSLDSK